MKIIPKILFIFLSVVLLAYVVWPLSPFPTPLLDARRSEEDGDNETTLRRAYFTDYTREEVMIHYLQEFGGIRLNYPPEESQTLIRDQTRSTFLEEVAQPLRGSVFVNGFEPKDPKDDVWYKGVDYRQKVIIRMYPSSVLSRFPLMILTLGAIWFLFKYWGQTLSELAEMLWKKK